jgi:hypothetical protein
VLGGPEVSNSRNSAQAAGWGLDADAEQAAAAAEQARADRLALRVNPKWDSFSWLTVRALLESVNDVVAKGGPTIVRRARSRWVSGQRAAGLDRARSPAGDDVPKGAFGDDFVVDWTALKGERPRFLLLGDPGEADASQYAAIDPLLAVHRGKDLPGQGDAKRSDFMVIVSDVVYPAGDINEYVNAFYLPYREYDAPIYALPGNHDWYDGLNGFMYHFCAAEPLPRETYRRWSYKPGDQAALALWRGAGHPDDDALAAWMAQRRRQEAGVTDPALTPARRARQPAPYFAIDIGSLLIVSIDTGVSGEIDAEQGQWLRRVSRRPGPKILLTGKPIYVDNDYHPCEIAWTELTTDVGELLGDQQRPKTVDDIVRHPDHRYVAAIGGDVHNYQRYPVRLADGRTLQYIVSGGGGAYLASTHMIETVGPRVEQKLPPEVDEFTESEFRCYPLRGDSLALFTRRIGPVLFNTILSAVVLIAAGCVELWWVYTGLDEVGDRRWAIIGAAAMAVLFLGAFVAGFVKPALVIEKVRPGLRGLAFLALVAVVAAIVTAVLIRTADAQISEAAGITLGLPVLGLAGVILAYNVRGSAPAITPVFLLLAPLVAAYEILLGFELHDGWDGLVFLVAPTVVALAALALLGNLARRIREGRQSGRWRAFKWALGLVWTGATVCLLLLHRDRHEAKDDALNVEWLWLWRSIGLLVVAGVLITLAIPMLSHGRAARQPAETFGVGSGPTAWIGLTFATLGLMLLQAIDLDAARDTAAAFATVLAVPAIGVLLAAAGWLQIGPSTLLKMRTGVIDSAQAAAVVADHHEIERLVRHGTPPAITRTGQVRMAEAVRRLGKPVSELADSNATPFYKNFLSAEVVGEKLIIRCWGATGQTLMPTLEDDVSISLRRRRA